MKEGLKDLDNCKSVLFEEENEVSFLKLIAGKTVKKFPRKNTEPKNSLLLVFIIIMTVLYIICLYCSLFLCIESYYGDFTKKILKKRRTEIIRKKSEKNIFIKNSTWNKKINLEF